MTSWSERAAAYEAACRLRRGDGSWSNDSLRQLADLYNIGYSTLRRWLKDGFPEPAAERGWMPTPEDYVAVATHLTVQEAWRERHDAGHVPVTYQTYCRRLKEVDRGLFESALHGHEALVRNRLYLIGKPLHRNHTWGFDHTELPVWVTIPRFKDPIKPWMTIVTDFYSRSLLSVMLIIGRPTAETVAAALTEAAVGRVYDGTFIGGLPVQVQYDNAKEHLGEVIAKGIARLGIVGVPIDNHAHWQNGQTETKVGLLQREALRGVPGVTLGGFTRSGTPRFMPPNRGDLWGIEKLARHLDEVRVHWNVGRVQGVLQGRAPVTKWLSDDTELVEIGEDSLVANMMKEGASHKILTKGVFFRNSYYTPVDDNHRAGEDVYVRYLERNADFIAISPTREFNHFTFAIHEDRITTANRVKLMQTRAKQEEMARRIDADATSRRLHGQAVSTDSEPTWSAVNDPADDWTPDGSSTSDRDHPAAVTQEPPSDLWGDIASGSAVDESTTPGAGEPEPEPDLTVTAAKSGPADQGSGSVTVINTERSRATPVHRRKAPLPPAPPRGEHPARTKARASRAADRVARRGLSTPKPPHPEEK
ncbi:hypothetical protein E9549_08610 [Blastococcus sp. MG754426]|uniref:hypothetical protein n=1 Tax=unclassified Blastococcus TaxID=2619396 RepID=UPI001EF157A7|nr:MULTISPECIES: hypothetical protein [unclassified Blastococcus]MCF6507469.1 hypothetical protein [Blastococcus sp. MG754426]MCF6512586.1 hypothetical protein [Blastococcus sp. MG754427]